MVIQACTECCCTVLSSQAQVSLGFRCIMRRFSEPCVNGQNAGTLAPPSAKKDVLLRTSVCTASRYWPSTEPYELGLNRNRFFGVLCSV